MQKFMIFDGSSIFYRAFFAMPPLTAPSGEPTGALAGFANIVLKILREYNPDFAAVALDKSKKTFRAEISADYKANREKIPDDLAAQFPLMKNFCEVLGLKTVEAEGFEADDVIGTLATQAAENFSVEIVTGDRDALQLINSSTKVLLNKNTKIEVYDEEKFFGEYDDGIMWNDPDIGVKWPLELIGGEDNLIIADKDKKLQSFKEFIKRYDEF